MIRQKLNGEQKGALLDLKFAEQLENRIAKKVLNEKGIVW
jgi:hypothetical protein